MAFDLSKVRRGVLVEPPRLVLYGSHGVGKTTFGAHAPDPIFLQFEDGEGLLSVARERIPDYGHLMEVVGALVNDKHDFKTVVVDTADWMEPIVWTETCRRKEWSDIEAPGFGKGYVAADEVWLEVISGLDACRSRGMQIIVLAHSEIKNFADPTTENYDRHQIKLHKRAWGLVQEWADAVGFLHMKTVIEKVEGGFAKKTTKGRGHGERVLYLEERPAFYAKNRYGLPSEIEMPTDKPEAMYAAFENAFTQAVERAAANT